MKMNGAAYDFNWLSHQALQKGAVLDFTMTANPNTKRGVNVSAFPYSYSTAKK